MPPKIFVCLIQNKRERLLALELCDLLGPLPERAAILIFICLLFPDCLLFLGCPSSAVLCSVDAVQPCVLQQARHGAEVRPEHVQAVL